MSTYDEDVVQYVIDNVKGKSIYELIDGIKKDLGKDETYNRIKRIKRNYNLRSELDCRFKKYSIPVNKGTKGLSRPNRTSFKEGNIPHNVCQIGDEVIKSDGYVYVKVDNKPKVKMQVNWIKKQRKIWEEHNGMKVPDGHRVIFADGNKYNFDINNLVLVTFEEAMYINKKHLIFEDAEATKTALNMVKLEIAIRRKEKNGKNRSV